MRVRQELKEISQTIEQELETFQRQRANDLRTMMIAFAKMHLQFCEEVFIAMIVSSLESMLTIII